MERLIEELIEKNELVYAGNIAYGDVETKNELLRGMIRSYEYPAYSHKIISGANKDEKQYANKYYQRVPSLDKTEEVTLSK